MFQVVEELRNWNFNLDNKLVEFSGRVLPYEVIHFGRNNKYHTNQSVDWTQSLRLNPMMVLGELKKWVIIYI